MMHSLVSVIMPVYKVEHYIGKAIESVLNQTYTYFELLVINDGTPDNSVAVAEKYLYDGRVRLLHKPNGGLSDARNFGLEHARGQYVYFVDSDDWIEPNLLELAILAMKRHDSRIVIFGYYLDTVDRSEALIESRMVVSPLGIFEKSKRNLEIDSRLLGILGYAWNKLYELEFLKTNNLHFTKGISLVEDILFNSEVYRRLEKLVVIETALYHYMNRPVVTLIKTFHQDSFELYLRKCEALERFLTDWNIIEKDRKVLLGTCMMEGIRYCGNNLIVFGKGLSEMDKFSYFRHMVTHPKMREFINSYKPISISEKIYKWLIFLKLSFFLYLILQIKKQ